MSLTASTIPTVIAALALVLGLVLLAAKGVRTVGFLRRSAGPPATRQVTVRETLALDRTRRLHLIQCGERTCMLLTGGTADLVVGWLPEGPGGDRA